MRNLLTLLCMLSTNAALAQDVYGTANGCARHGGAEVFGEGQEWQLEYVIEETDVSDRLIIFPIDTPEAREEINLCK